MALPHAKSGDIIDIGPLGSGLAEAGSTTLVNTNTLEIIRMVIHAGREIPEHLVHGETTLQCLEGRLAVTVGDAQRELRTGQMLYLAGDVPHSLRALEDASVLLTILLHRNGGHHAYRV